MCVHKCPLNAPVPDEYGICRNPTEVYLDKPFWDGFENFACTEVLGGEYFYDRYCVKACPEPLVADKHKICKTCAEVSPELPLWDGNACTACPDNKY